MPLIVRGVELSGVNLGGLDLVGTELEGAVLEDTRSFGLIGCPASLPESRWTCVRQPRAESWVLLGPTVALSGADLRGTNLGGANLGEASLRGTKLDGLEACPLSQPPAWRCVAQPSSGTFALGGPGVNLSGAVRPAWSARACGCPA